MMKNIYLSEKQEFLNYKTFSKQKIKVFVSSAELKDQNNEQSWLQINWRIKETREFYRKKI